LPSSPPAPHPTTYCCSSPAGTAVERSDLDFCETIFVVKQHASLPAPPAPPSLRSDSALQCGPEDGLSLKPNFLHYISYYEPKSSVYSYRFFGCNLCFQLFSYFFYNVGNVLVMGLPEFLLFLSHLSPRDCLSQKLILSPNASTTNVFSRFLMPPITGDIQHISHLLVSLLHQLLSISLFF